jgi:hypothetical protein
VHRVNDVQLSDAIVSYLEIDEHLRDDTDYAASMDKCRFGYSAHQTYLGATVDNADVVRSERTTQVDSSSLIGRIGPIGRGTKDSDIANWHTFKDTARNKRQPGIQ